MPPKCDSGYNCVPLQLFGMQVTYLRFFKYFYQFLVPRTPPARTPPPSTVSLSSHMRDHPTGACTTDDMGCAAQHRALAQVFYYVSFGMSTITLLIMSSGRISHVIWPYFKKKPSKELDHIVQDAKKQKKKQSAKFWK
jgi:hypothetical protein